MKSRIDYYTDEELKEIVATSTSYKEVLRKLGYNSNGGNHKTLKNKL